jgi:GntR family transcriptional repressor for pyruvate dehydrogenase complex
MRPRSNAVENIGPIASDWATACRVERLEARLLLEPEIARLAAERRDDDDLAALRCAVAAERSARTAAAAHDASRAFHAALVAATRNDALVRTFDALWIADVGRRLLARRRSQPDWQESDVAEHAELLEAVVAGNGNRARLLMRAHVESAWRHWSRRGGADG